MSESIDTTASGQKPKPTGRPGGERRLSVVYPPELVGAIRLEEDEVVLGRECDGAGRLVHRTVSRRHAELAWDAGAGMHRVRDLGSHNGSSVDGRSIAGDPTAIMDGTVMRLGDVLLVYEATRTAVPDSPWVSNAAIPGESFAARLLRSEVARAAPDPSPVLLVGDTGTGKESIAREIHRLSDRSGELVALNCAALARELVEAQLFGHVRGAFTGAADSQPGLFRAAHEGTLFLDEIGELPLDLQPKLLRAIQEREIQPVGAAHPVKVDVRIVAATNRDLAADTDSGAFRRDLYARIALWEIRVPPLRARRRDLLAWMALLHQAWRSRRAGPPQALVLDPDAAEALLLAPWTENLRGVERLVHMIGTELNGGAIGLEDLPDWVLGRTASPSQPVAEKEGNGGGEGRKHTPSKEELTEVLAMYGGSIRATARHYGRDRRQVYRWIEAYGLKAKKD
jgi:transcriptional regulator with GAF, ATPase, and Fis domain